MSPFVAGLSVITLAIALNVSAGVTGTILPRLTHYKVIPVIGLVIAIVALIVLALRARDVSLLEFQILLAIIGVGFGGMPPLSATMLQNSVSISTFGTAVATMQFSRNLYCTMMVASFGAIVLTGPLEGAAAGYSVEGFVRIFFVAAASFALSLLAVLLVEAKPLQTTHA
jgi:MFS family permease